VSDVFPISELRYVKFHFCFSYHFFFHLQLTYPYNILCVYALIRASVYYIKCLSDNMHNISVLFSEYRFGELTKLLAFPSLEPYAKFENRIWSLIGQIDDRSDNERPTGWLITTQKPSNIRKYIKRNWKRAIQRLLNGEFCA
jgi:hypothetical protein